MAEIIPYRFKLRGATAAEWTAANTILLAREPGVETDTGGLKIGDGVTGWNALPYSGQNMTQLVADMQADADAAAAEAADQAVLDAGTYTDLRETAIRGGAEIPAGSDLNTYQSPGLYYQSNSANATLLLNYPQAAAGLLQVLRWATGSHRIQVYIPWTMDGFYTRRYYNSLWGTWTRYDTAAQAAAAITAARDDAVATSQAYADNADAAVRDDFAAADTTTLTNANLYTDSKVNAASLGNVSLDTILTPGPYYQGNPAYVTTANAYPAAASGRVYLEVKTVGTNDANLIQVLTVQTGAMFKRHRYNSLPWTDWLAFDTDGKAYTDSIRFDRTANVAAGTDLNTMTTPGQFSIASTSPNTPVAGHIGGLTVMKINTVVGQTFLSWTNQTFYHRTRNTDNTWRAWVQLGTKAEIDAVPRYVKPDLPVGQDWDLVVEDGLYKQALTPTDWVAQHLPASGRFTLRVENLLSAAKTQTAILWSTSPRMFVRTYSASGWTAWREIDPAMTPEYLVNPVNLNNLGHGRHETAHYQMAATPADWPANNFPEPSARGRIVHMRFSSTHAFQVFYQWSETATGTMKVWHRNSVSGVWTPWVSDTKDIAELKTRVDALQASTPGSGYKTVGLPITAGPGTANGPLAGTYRMPFDWISTKVKIARVKVRLRNIDIRGGTTAAGTITLDGVWMGPLTAEGNFSSTPTQIAGPTTFDGAVGWESPWVEVPNQDLSAQGISYAYAAPSAPYTNLGTGFSTTTRVGPNTGAVGMTAAATMAFAVDLVVETPGTTPVIATIGDSNSVGVGAKAVRDAWGVKLAQRLNALPQLLGSSGDTVSASQDTTKFKWNRFPGHERADAILWALGQNDVGANYTLDKITTDLKAIVPQATKLGRAIYTVSIMPRTGATFDEALRRSVNLVLQDQKAMGSRGYFDIIPAMSADDETIIASMDADSTHLNATGFTAVADRIADTYQVTTSPVTQDELAEALAGNSAAVNDTAVAGLLADPASQTSQQLVATGKNPKAREARADYVASWMRQEVWNDRGDRFPAGAVRRIRLKKPTLATPYLTNRYTGDEDVNSTSASLSLQFLALYATHYPAKASDVRPLVDHLASYLMGMQVNDTTQARHGGIPLAANDPSCGTLSAAQAGIGFLKAYKVWGAGEWMAAALRVGEFLRTMIDPNPKYQALYGVNVIDVPAGTVPIADRITSGDVFRCTATGWNLTAVKFLYQLADATGDESWRTLATPARDFMSTIVTGGYDYFHTKGAADGIAAGRVITNWTNQSSLDFNDNQFHRQGDAINPPNGTTGTDQLEYGLSALYETGYNLTALRTAYEYWVSLPNADSTSAPTFAPAYDGRVCLTGYIRFDSVVYEGASMAFGSYYDAQGAGELLKWKQEQYPDHYLLSLPIVQAVLHPEAGALLDENYDTVWSAEDGGYTATQGVIPIAMSGIGLMETAGDYDQEVTA